jgi:ABC-type branched-subunit amino acid transport system ATPase component
MFTSATIENFRGIERLTVEGLGRVNLIIGKNNSGKTALMEALWVAASTRAAGVALANLQIARMHGSEVMDNFDEFWRPIFRGGDAERGFLVRAWLSEGGDRQFTMQKVPGPSEPEQPVPITTSSQELTVPFLPWTLQYKVEEQGRTEPFQVLGRPGSITFPRPTQPEENTLWMPTGPQDLSLAIRLLSKLKQQGRDGVVRDLLRYVDNMIESIEILSPTGGRAAIFVRVSGEPMLLPLRAMGEGIQRCFEMAVLLSSADALVLAIDEIENGLHYSVLESVWKWLAEVSARRKVQVFATTHSEECVYAACHAFLAMADEGLRVIRLDRQEHGTEAKVYDRDLVAATERMDIEIRG